MDESVPDTFDVIVYGTGFPESVLAAACAKAGLSVLHFDKNSYYGGSWASFNLDQIYDWIEQQQSSSAEPEVSLETLIGIAQLTENERLLQLQPLREFTDVEAEWLVQDNETPQTDDNEIADTESNHSTSSGSTWTKASILELSKRFSLDLTPKVLFSRGAAIDALVNSKVSRYAEFKLVDRILTLIDGNLKVIPCSKSDVFQTDQLDVVEKRMLMKFLNFCFNYEQERDAWIEFESQPFCTFLNHKQLPPKLQHYVLYALANGCKSTTTVDALKSIYDFINSTGRYGNSPFLWTMYGSGELPQCFCRTCAVFGGIYCLRTPLQALIVNDQEKTIPAVLVSQRRINCSKQIVMPSSNLLCPVDEAKYSVYSKAILITTKSILVDDRDHISYLNVQLDEESDSTISLLEVSCSGMACPRGLNVVYLSTKKRRGPKEDFECLTKTFFCSTDENKPKILWRMTFCQKADKVEQTSLQPGYKNLISVPLPDHKLDYEDIMNKVSSIFASSFDNMEFFPMLPEENEEEEDPGEANPNHKHNDCDAEAELNTTESFATKKLETHNVL